MYLQYLLQEDDDSLLHKVYTAQAEHPIRGDWVEQVKKDMNEIELDISMEVIKRFTKEAFKQKVSKAVNKAAFQYLCSEKKRMSKVMYVPHDNFKLQEYFHPSLLDIQEVKMLFMIRSRMVDVKINFRNKYADTLCPVCKTVGVEDSQEHVMECVQLLNNKNILANREIKYSHIFDSDVRKQIAATRMFYCLWNERKKILKLD